MISAPVFRPLFVLFGIRVQVHVTFHYVMLMDCTFTKTTGYTEYSTMFYESLFCQYNLSAGRLGEKNKDNVEYVALQSCSPGIEMIPKVYLSHDPQGFRVQKNNFFIVFYFVSMYMRSVLMFCIVLTVDLHLFQLSLKCCFY